MSRLRPDRSSSSDRSRPDPGGSAGSIPDRAQSQASSRPDRGTPFAEPVSEVPPGMRIDPEDAVGSSSPSSNEPPTRPAAPPSFNTAHDRSQIDEHSSFDGKFHTAHDLVVNGAMEGEVTCEGQLIVAEGARIKAQVTAANITVAGELEGEINCTGLLDILPSGRLKGTVSTGRLSVQEGAVCEGSLQMSPPASETAVAAEAEGEPTAIFKTPVRKVE
jgi:cytoskeletal protein CcmA (bactofilin family)